MAKTCPFDQGTLQPLEGREGAMMLLNVLVSKNSAIRGMIEGAANRIMSGVHKCDTCGFIAIFSQ